MQERDEVLPLEDARSLRIQHVKGEPQPLERRPTEDHRHAAHEVLPRKLAVSRVIQGAEDASLNASWHVREQLLQKPLDEVRSHHLQAVEIRSRLPRIALALLQLRASWTRGCARRCCRRVLRLRGILARWRGRLLCCGLFGKAAWLVPWRRLSRLAIGALLGLGVFLGLGGDRGDWRCRDRSVELGCGVRGRQFQVLLVLREHVVLLGLPEVLSIHPADALQRAHPAEQVAAEGGLALRRYRRLRGRRSWLLGAHISARSAFLARLEEERARFGLGGILHRGQAAEATLEQPYLFLGEAAQRLFLQQVLRRGVPHLDSDASLKLRCAWVLSRFAAPQQFKRRSPSTYSATAHFSKVS
eukprot:scaffold886_cov249-Pinguiococcus_pyrenoidosus.AAC.8